MTALAYVVPDSEKMIASAETALAIPENFAIATAEEYTDAAAKLKIVKSFADEWEKERKTLKAPILEAGKLIDEKFKAASERLATYERRIKTALVAYTEEQERIRREEQRRLEEVARKERERLEAEATKAREKAEREARELAEKAAAERAAGNVAAAAKLEAKAETVVDKAEAKAEQKIAQAAAVPLVAPRTPAPPKVEGLKYTQQWYAEIVDVNAIPREYMVPDLTKIEKVAQALKGPSPIPGVAFKSHTVAASSKR